MADALELAPDLRAALAEKLLGSLADQSQSEMDALWAAEAEARIDAHAKGEIEAIPSETVFRELGLEDPATGKR